jgi:hypothetical protein
MWACLPGSVIDSSKLNESPIFYSNPMHIEKAIVSSSGAVFLLQNYETIRLLSYPNSSLVSLCEYFLLENMQLIVSIYKGIYLTSVEYHLLF